MDTNSPATALQAPPITMDYSRSIFDNKPDEPQASSTVPTVASSSGAPTVPTMQNASLTVGPNAGNSNLLAKKCLFHRQCNRNHLQQQTQLAYHQQQQQQIRINNNTINISASPISNSSANSSGGSNAATNQRGQTNRDAVSTNVVPQLNAALLHDRYLLLELVDGSSFYGCVDIKTQKPLVCKVSSKPYSFPSLNPLPA